MTKTIAILCVFCIALGSSFSGLTPVFQSYLLTLDQGLELVAPFLPSVNFKAADPITSKLENITINEQITPYPVSFNPSNALDYTEFYDMWLQISDVGYPQGSSRVTLPKIIRDWYGSAYDIYNVGWYPDIYSISGDFTYNNSTLECVKIHVDYGLKIIPDFAEVGLLGKGKKSMDFYIPLAENLRVPFNLPDGSLINPIGGVYTLDKTHTLSVYVWGNGDEYDFTQKRTFVYRTVEATTTTIYERFKDDN